jgi:uncharacterized 2Fe-2S/4Fe-4S cluster protein (DUF4445 family)
LKHAVRFRIPPEDDVVFLAEHGLSLLDAAREAGIDIDSPCSGNGTCGKCAVRIVSDNGNPNGEVSTQLACQTIIQADLCVEIPNALRFSKNSIKDVGIENESERNIFNCLRKEMESLKLLGDCGIELVTLKLKAPTLDDSAADSERLLRALNKGGAAVTDISLHALRKLPTLLRQSDFTCSCVISRKQETLRVVDVFPGTASDADGEGKPLIAGLAIDIGTTSVAAVLTNLLTGEVLASASKGNTQIRWGADVINRIIESTRDGGLERLRRAIVHECLIPLIQELVEHAKIKTSQIYMAAIAANTTMTHLFIGVPPEYLRLEPYVPAFFHANGLKAVDLDLPLHPEAEALIAPSVGSYVGGDISAGLFASMIFRKETSSLFIDLGTNGEIVFGNREFLMACACSAGPAFEGGDINCGMRAVAGAIDSVCIDAKSLEPTLTIIGKRKAIGICGSGLIDLVAELFAAGLINARGKFIFERGSKRLRRDEYGMASYVLVFADETENGKDVLINEGDIENFIRAKGAIYSAIRTMLAVLDYGVKDIDNAYIAGGIGSGINIEKAISIGMLPNIPKERYHYIGNSSLAGAYAMLQSQKAAEKIEEIAGMTTYLELSSHSSYMDEFVAACFLPHTNSELFNA